MGQALPDPEHQRLRQALATVVSQSLVPQLAPELEAPPIHDLLEEPSMLAETALEWREGWIREGREEGREEGLAEGIVTLLESRGIEVSDEARRRIFACHDHDVLRRWLVRAASVKSTEAVFDDEDT